MHYNGAVKSAFSWSGRQGKTKDPANFKILRETRKRKLKTARNALPNLNLQVNTKTPLEMDRNQVRSRKTTMVVGG
jgi:hypothetical protein